MEASTKRRSGAIVWLTFSLGMVTTALGVAYAVAAPASSVPNEVVAAVIGSLGAGVVGAALSILITSLADHDGREDLAKRLSEVVGARFTSDEVDLSLLRADLHHYHITTVDGRYVWRYIRYKIDDWSRAAGSLRYPHQVTDGQGHVYRFTAEVGVRGQHVVILSNGASGESGAQASEIFPTFVVHSYRPYHCGLGIYRTWDNRSIVGKIIISRDSLAPADTDGAIPEDHFARLDDIWDVDFLGQYDLLPAAQLQPGSSSPPGRPS